MNPFLRRPAAIALTSLTCLLALTAQGKRVNLNPAWRFHEGGPNTASMAVDYDDSAWDLVSLPHSHTLVTANLGGFSRSVGWYRRTLVVPSEWRDKKLFLEFQGAMQATTLWVNGQKAGDYAVSGYDSFHFDITPYVKEGRNIIAVKVDNRPSYELPPDGTKTDYMLFGGLYRDVFLHVMDSAHFTFPWETRQAGVSLTLPEISPTQAVVQLKATIRNESKEPRNLVLVAEIRDKDGKAVSSMRQEQHVAAGAEHTFVQKTQPIPNPQLWSPETPYLYQVHTALREGDRELDRVQTPLGLRWVRFDKTNGFFLNGKPMKLVGANRHQTWPFIGNAVPNGLHRRDAEQLKAMGVNWVRLSHYPHDPDFLDALDELGLMAVAEPPTWMQPGSDKWMDNLEKSFRSMIRRDRNHPSIILWAACINHHNADPRLVRAALEEDPTHERGQDTVLLPMAFSHGNVPGHGSLCIEHTGHTFPAARGQRATRTRVLAPPHDTVETSVNREYEQAQRHWEQLNAAYQKPDNCGLAVWCMCDYNTFHNTSDIGLVWHGVCDLFRIPKYSFYWHQSELTDTPMAYVVRVDDTLAAVFSNCEKVRLWQDEGEGFKQIATQSPETKYTTPSGEVIQYAVHHPPFLFTVSRGAKALKAEGLVGTAVKARYHWKQPGRPAALLLEADRPLITADGADLSRIIVTAVDTNNTPVDTCTLPVDFTIKGVGQLIGENPANLRAGKMIILAQSGYVPGTLTISASSPGLLPASTEVKMQAPGPDVDLPKDLPAQQPTPRSIAAAHPPLAHKRSR